MPRKKPRKEIKLNLGCNEWNIKGFINIDIDKNDKIKPDLQADCSDLPFEDNSVDEIYAGHMLEHFDMTENVLEEWHRVLKPGGRITICIPDIERALKELREGRITLHWFNQVVYGAADRKRQEHHEAYTIDILASKMNVYFKDLMEVTACPYWVADVPWQSTITAIK